MMQFPSKVNALKRMRVGGLEISCIVDVGVNKSTSELIVAFPDVFHYLIEPVPFYHSQISRSYSDVPHQIFTVAIGASPKVTAIQTYAVDDGSSPTHARIVDLDSDNLKGLSGFYEQDGPNRLFLVDSYSLDDFIQNNITEQDHKTNILLKIDVDSNDLEILSSLKDYSRCVNVVIIETHLSDMVEIIRIANDRGFALFEVVDLCYMRGSLRQMDLIFVKDEICKSLFSASVSPAEIWQQWFQLSSLDPNPWTKYPD